MDIQQGKSWATHFRFLTFPQLTEHFIPKAGLKTWHDLKYELDDHVHIDHRYIDIAINNLKTFFADDTLLEDVDLKQSDECIVLVRRQFDHVKQQQEFEDYQRMVENSINKNRQKIEKKKNDPFFRQAMQKVNGSQKTKKIYSQLLNKYSKWQILTAFNKCTAEEVQKCLASGRAKKWLSEKIEDEQRLQIDAFIKKDDIQQLRKAILLENSTPAVYQAVMRKIFQKYPQFIKLQIRHKEYVYNQLTGKYEKEVMAVLAEVERKRKPKYIAQAEVESLKNRYIQSGRRGEQVDEMIRLAGNNLVLAEQFLKSGPVDSSQNLTMCLSKASAMNFVLQFFSQPLFSEILPKLTQNVAKCNAFLEHILTKYKKNALLCTLIKTYRQYIVTVLSGVSVIEGQKNLKSEQPIEFTSQLSTQQQQAQKEKIFAVINRKLVQELTKFRVQQKVAVSALRAASNDLQKIEPYILLGGVNKKYHFCGSSCEEEQTFLQKHFKEEKELLSKLEDKHNYSLWLASTYETSPLLFDIIIRNKPFLDKLVRQSLDK